MEDSRYIDNKIRDHLHDGNFSQRINLNNLFGTIDTVSSSPTAIPTSFYEQFKIYLGQLWFYDFTTGLWDSSVVNASNATTATNALTVSTFTPLFDHFIDAGNVTTGETDLYSDTIAANTLSANGTKILSEYGGTFVSSGSATRQVRIYFGGTAIFDTGALTLSLSSAWTVYTDIIRVSATVIRYSISFTTEGAALSAYTSVGEVTGLTLSNTNILKITGQAAGVGAATNDIVAKMGYVERHAAA